jgi:hypothetical protein
MTAMFVTDRDKISNLYRGPSIDASYEVVKARAVSKITIPTYKLDSNILYHLMSSEVTLSLSGNIFKINLETYSQILIFC